MLRSTVLSAGILWVFYISSVRCYYCLVQLMKKLLREGINQEFCQAKIQLALFFLHKTPLIRSPGQMYFSWHSLVNNTPTHKWNFEFQFHQIILSEIPNIQLLTVKVCYTTFKHRVSQ